MGKYVSAFVLILVLRPVVGVAQTISGPVAGGACAIKVTLPTAAVDDTSVELLLNKNKVVGTAIPLVGANDVTVTIHGPVKPGNELRAWRIVNGKRDPSPGDSLTVTKDGEKQCTASEVKNGDEVISDERDTFDASLYLGKAVDNFAPAAVGGYANAELGGKQPLRYVGGADFEFRLKGSAEKRRQLWIFGETMHGVRTADINCADANDRPPVCEKLTVGPDGNASKQLQFVMENASSLEAYAGVRYEFLTLQADTDTPAKVYATARWGVMMLTGKAKAAAGPGADLSQATEFQANHAYQAHHVGLGLLLPKGKFDGSVLEVGWGLTQLFDHANVRNTLHGWNRLKVDGALSVQIKGPMYGFLQMYSDFGPVTHVSDSVQTFFGVSFEVPEFFR